ncbi:biopolymer transporter Tol [Coraliomargarita sinensis]|uniref:Biopolymer transporter Tol n=1 Tax=Coraliomargarita sinensis TaxID=2174842 RepID=A0A317ZG56_9BACT|nr:PD40 domain-containing protein [Coraliomargarita sinensis]PXA04595.1 biopolymer transporter Tol [Coraliomargarita sinensis]
MRLSTLFLLPCLLIGSLTTGLHAQINIGEAIRQGEGRVAIAVDSSDAATRTLARRAFGLHGGITVTTPANAAFAVRIERAGGGDAALVTVGSGQPYKEQLRRTVPGRDYKNAVLRACDLVVQATLESNGFFAGKLAFVGKQRGVSEIYVSDLLFSEVRPLTRDRALVTGPRWAPDGSRLLYTTYYKTGFPDIYSINLATGRKQPIATFKGTNTGGAYSPDGRRIAMTLSGTGNSEIYISDTRGKNIRRLTTNKSNEASPNWSPDGRRLVYTSDAPGKPQLYQISVNGGAPQRIPTNISSYCSEPVWNPVDPNKIAFTASIGGGFQIAVYDFKTRRSKQITSGASSVEPYWLGDGRHLVFTKREGGRTRLMIVDSETGKVAALHQPGFGDASSASFVY